MGLASSTDPSVRNPFKVLFPRARRSQERCQRQCQGVYSANVYGKLEIPGGLIRLQRLMQNQMRKAGGRNGKHIKCGLLRQQLTGSAGFPGEAKAYMCNTNTWPNIGPITMNWDETKWDRILPMSRRFLGGVGGRRVSVWVFLGVGGWGGSCLRLFHLNVDDSSRSAMVGTMAESQNCDNGRAVIVLAIPSRRFLQSLQAWGALSR